MESEKGLSPLSASVLTGLRIFAAVVRRGSYLGAAEELGITQSAVSHRIKQLERELQLRLLWRTTRKLSPTPEGKQLWAATEEALNALEQTITAIRQRHDSGVLTVAVLSSLAIKWLIPRLNGFQSAHPTIKIHISADDALSDLAAGSADVAIRFGSGTYTGYYTQLLTHEDIFPVCSPRWLAGSNRMRSIDELGRYELLYDESGCNDGSGYAWDYWLQSIDKKDVELSTGTAFNRADLVIQAAVAGQGIALGRTLLVADDLADARLVLPFAAHTRAKFSYYLVMRHECRSWPKVQAFAAWLMAAMRASYVQTTALLESGVPSAPYRRTSR